VADYLPIVMMFGVATLFAVASIFVSSKMGPHDPTPAKEAPYECGITPVQSPASERFPVKFYLVAMLFIIFDIELVFFYPWAVIFRELHLFGLAEMGVFVALLLVVYFYILRSGVLDWSETGRRVPRGRTALVSDPAALRSPGEGGSGMEELLADCPAGEAAMPADKVVL
jgi:NADH-quinone oxidoreductase subunit A